MKNKKGIAIAVFAVGVCVAGYLLYRNLRDYSAAEILASVTATPLPNLAAAIGFAAASYLCLTGFDFLGARHVGRPQPYPRAALASFVSLSLGHSIGFAALSSGAVRYKFYSAWGLSTGEIAGLILFCGLTVGLGLTGLVAITALTRPDLAAGLIGIAPAAVMGIGAAAVGVLALYLAAAWRIRRPLKIRQFELSLPDVKTGALQIVLGTVNFAFVAACLHQALAAAARTDYLTVAAAYVLANVGTLITHAPGGLGVIETIVTMSLPGATVIGALLVFRAVYFLLPLSLGLILFAATSFTPKEEAAPPAGAARPATVRK